MGGSQGGQWLGSTPRRGFWGGHHPLKPPLVTLLQPPSPPRARRRRAGGGRRGWGAGAPPGGLCSRSRVPPAKRMLRTPVPKSSACGKPPASPCTRTSSPRPPAAARPTIKVCGGEKSLGGVPPIFWGGVGGIPISIPPLCLATGSCNESESNDESIPELEEPEGSEPPPAQTQVGWGFFWGEGDDSGGDGGGELPSHFPPPSPAGAAHPLAGHRGGDRQQGEAEPEREEGQEGGMGHPPRVGFGVPGWVLGSPDGVGGPPWEWGPHARVYRGLDGLGGEIRRGHGSALGC